MNSQQTSMVDPNDNETRYSYDPAGQLAMVIEGFDADVDAAATGTSDVNVTTVYDWTDTGNLASIVDPNGNKTVFDYNAAGQVTSETNPLGKSWDYSYDSLGRLSSQVDGNRQTTNYSYTSRSDLAQISYPGSSVSFEYDANQQPIAMTDPLGVTGWKYDANGLMTEQIDANGSRLGYAYDAAQQLTALTMPTGESIGYEYDEAGRPVAQTSPWGNIAYEWDPAGNLTKGEVWVLGQEVEGLSVEVFAEPTLGTESQLAVSMAKTDGGGVLSMFPRYSSEAGVRQLVLHGWRSVIRALCGEDPQVVRQITR